VGIFGRRKKLDPSPWVLQGWDRPNQAQIRQFTRANSHAWDCYITNLCQVDCKGENEAAIFLKVGFDYPAWSESVEPVGHAWRWFSVEGYVVLQLSMYFLDPQKRSIGLHAPGQVTVMTKDLIEKVGSGASRKLGSGPQCMQGLDELQDPGGVGENLIWRERAGGPSVFEDPLGVVLRQHQFRAGGAQVDQVLLEMAQKGGLACSHHAFDHHPGHHGGGRYPLPACRIPLAGPWPPDSDQLAAGTGSFAAVRTWRRTWRV